MSLSFYSSFFELLSTIRIDCPKKLFSGTAPKNGPQPETSYRILTPVHPKIFYQLLVGIALWQYTNILQIVANTKIVCKYLCSATIVELVSHLRYLYIFHRQRDYLSSYPHLNIIVMGGFKQFWFGWPSYQMNIRHNFLYAIEFHRIILFLLLSRASCTQIFAYNLRICHYL